jgi:hypothetical protein
MLEIMKSEIIFSFLFDQNHFLPVLYPKHEISKRHLKKHIFTRFLRFFLADITSNIFKSNIFLIDSTRAFDWCINCHIWMREKFRLFLVRVPPYGENRVKFFFSSRYKILYTNRIPLSSLLEICCF